jgi:hypothetical protein
MKLEITWDINELMNLDKNVSASVQLMLIDVWNFISNQAKENSPYLTWALRRSISPDFNGISKWFAIVGSPLAYASIREYVNNKNPHTKFYLQRAYTEHKDEIFRIIMEDLNDKIKK